MPIPAIRKNTPQTIQSGGTTPPPQSTPQPSAASIADDAAGRINELRGNLRVRGGRIGREQAVSMLANTYERAGISGVNQLLLASPRLVASLGGSSREELESALAVLDELVEAPHIAHAFAHEGAAMGGVALGTFVAGIAVGVMIHHAAEENREAFIAAGREQLGL